MGGIHFEKFLNFLRFWNLKIFSKWFLCHMDDHHGYKYFIIDTFYITTIIIHVNCRLIWERNMKIWGHFLVINFFVVFRPSCVISWIKMLKTNLKNEKFFVAMFSNLKLATNSDLPNRRWGPFFNRGTPKIRVFHERVPYTPNRTPFRSATL